MNWIHDFHDAVSPWLGLDTEPRDLSLLQLSARALVVFIASLAMLRLAHKRFFAAKNAIDVLLTFILASTLSRAINGSAAFFGTIGVGFVLVVLHDLATRLACYFPQFGKWVKGHHQVVVQDGKVLEHLLKKHHVSHEDLEQDLRQNAGTERADSIRLATLERNGEISVVRRPQVFTVAVEKGVQTVRIEVEG